MKIIMRTSIILALALVIVGLTYAANQAGAFQNIGTEHSEGAEFGMHLPAPDNNAIGAQTSVRPERSGHRPGEGRGHADGEMGGISSLGEIIKSLGIVSIIVVLFVIGQRLWLAMQGPRKQRTSQQGS